MQELEIKQKQVKMKLNNFKLFKYAVFIPWDGKLYVKDGEHKDIDEAGVRKYVANETVGKIRSLITEDMLIGIVDMSSHAIELNSQYNPNLEDGNRKGSYDKEIVHNFSFLKQLKIINLAGGKSLELYEVPKGMERDEIRYLWNKGHEVLLNGGKEVSKKIYNARPFTEDFDCKICKGKVKHLLGGCPGSGKEQASLTLLIRISDKLEYDNTMVNIFTATYPATLCEPLNELSEVQGMNINGDFIDNNRLKVYIIEKWYKKNRKDLKPGARQWCDKNATFIKDSKEIPATHPKGQVPVLIAGYHEIARTSTKKLREEYQSLVGRVGTLVIGEAHRFLKKKNKMWQVIKQLQAIFLMPVTGTPYELIFGEDDNELFFGPDERSIMTRQQMMNMKKADPTGPFKDMPDIHYYGIGNEINQIIEEMKKDSKWKSDADGMTYEKLIMTYDRTQKGTKKFKYWDQIFRLFSRKFGVSPFGTPDPMSIKALPNLCDKAKENVLIYLPTGSKEFGGVSEVIPELVRLLNEHGALGNHEGLTASDENVDDLRDKINSPKPTAVFTCYAKATGTNIPAWGLSIVMRKIGNSLIFIEQAFDGRPSRAFKDKPNCGVVLTELYNIANIKILAEEKLSGERNENKSHLDIINEHLDCNFYYSFKDGAFKEIERPDFQKALENITNKKGYEAGICINQTQAPDSFNDLSFKTNNGGSVNVEVGENNNEVNERAKNKIIKKIKNGEQLSFEFEDKDRDKSWNEMKKTHLSILRIIGWAEGLKTLNEIYDYICKAIDEDDMKILNQIRGYEYLGLGYLLDPKEVDQTMAQRFFDKLYVLKDIDSLLEVINDDSFLFSKGKGDVMIEYEEAEDFINEFPDKVWKSGKGILEPNVKKGTILNAIRKKLLSLGIGIEEFRKRVKIVDGHELNVKIVKKVFDLPNESCYNSIDDIKKEKNMKFGVIGTNPAYQKGTGNMGQGQSQWDESILTNIDLLEDDGYLGMYNPNGYRNIKSSYDDVKEALREIDIIYLEIHNIEDGLKTFKCATRYDKWIAQKRYTNNLKTKVIDELGKEHYMDLKSMQLIPNFDYAFVQSLIAKPGELKVELIGERSMYPPDKPWMSETKNETNNLPCIKYSPKDDEKTGEPQPLDLKYSSKDLGMFGVPKVVFGFGAQVGKIFADKKGEYGLCQWVGGIADEPEVLDDIVKAMTSEKFLRLMKALQFSTQAYNGNAIREFRKDFWKSFI